MFSELSQCYSSQLCCGFAWAIPGCWFPDGAASRDRKYFSGPLRLLDGKFWTPKREGISPNASNVSLIFLVVAWEERSTYLDWLLPLDERLSYFWSRPISATGVEGQVCSSPTINRTWSNTGPVHVVCANRGSLLLPMSIGVRLSGLARHINYGDLRVEHWLIFADSIVAATVQWVSLG